ncbi:MAG: cache domain-containing protein, partial [Oceanospirillum sp.]|nr:cache domain-containing protein [Oceanospirillum sp.]
MDSLFRNFRIQHRIWFMLLLTFTSMAALLFITLKQERASFDELKKTELRHLTQSVTAMFDALDAKVKAGAMSLQDAQNLALDQVRSTRFGDNDYFWVMDIKGTYLMHPIKASLAGVQAEEIKDVNGKYFMAHWPRELASKGESFAEYYWNRPGSNKPIPKITYVLAYKPWNWSVATGVYIDDIE